jgi:general stress protein 26
LPDSFYLSLNSHWTVIDPDISAFYTSSQNLTEWQEVRMDLKGKIYEVIKDNPLGALATLTKDGRPRVRYIVLTVERDLSIRFVTSLTSRKVAQINLNPEVHVTCGAVPDDSLAPYVQVEGKATISRDEKIRKKMWRPTLENYFTGPDDSDYCVGIIEPYRIEYFGTAMTPEVWEPTAAMVLHS